MSLHASSSDILVGSTSEQQHLQEISLQSLQWLESKGLFGLSNVPDKKHDENQQLEKWTTGSGNEDGFLQQQQSPSANLGRLTGGDSGGKFDEPASSGNASGNVASGHHYAAASSLTEQVFLVQNTFMNR